MKDETVAWLVIYVVKVIWSFGGSLLGKGTILGTGGRRIGKIKGRLRKRRSEITCRTRAKKALVLLNAWPHGQMPNTQHVNHTPAYE